MRYEDGNAELCHAMLVGESETRGTCTDQSHGGPACQMRLPIAQRLEACLSHARAAGTKHFCRGSVTGSCFSERILLGSLPNPYGVVAFRISRR